MLEILRALAERQISGGRLQLIPQTGLHARAMFPLLNDRALHKFTGGAPPESAEVLESRFVMLQARVSPDIRQLWLNWIIRLSGTGELIGYVQATVEKRHADIAWVIGTAWQGKGYGTEASRLMLDRLLQEGVRTVCCHIRSDHAASQAIARKLGMVRTNRTENGEEIWQLGPAE